MALLHIIITLDCQFSCNCHHTLLWMFAPFPELVEKLGWKTGDELEAGVKDKKLVISEK